MKLAPLFHDRADAGRTLATSARSVRGPRRRRRARACRAEECPWLRGREALGAPLDVFLVRKLGTPGHRELAMGAIASGGVRVMNDEVVAG
jgi:predicted phosphoribosyltransferase